MNFNVNMVVNYDVPCKVGSQFDEKVYTYRVSRTGRFGTHGMAITLNSGSVTDIKKILKREYAINMVEIVV